MGPGSSSYPHASITVGRYGEGAEAYYLFEPKDPVPIGAPVVVFLHGYSGTDPSSYGSWIKHLVRRGNIVVYPVYQENLRGASQYTANAVKAIEDALQELKRSGHVLPNEQNFALVGHSLGGTIAVNIAATAHRLPRAKALMLVNAGDSNSMFQRLAPILTEDVSGVPSSTLFLAIVGEDDQIAGNAVAQHVYSKLTQLPPENRNIVMLRSDRHGSVPLEANHFAPNGRDDEITKQIQLEKRHRNGRQVTTDALDFYGYWKWLDGLLDASFNGTNRNYALGGTPEQLFMGEWSDGVPVIRAQLGGATIGASQLESGRKKRQGLRERIRRHR